MFCFKKKSEIKSSCEQFFLGAMHLSHPSFFFHISKENYIYNPHLKLTYIHPYIEIYFAGNGLNNITHVVFKLCSFSAFLIVDTLLLYVSPCKAYLNMLGVAKKYPLPLICHISTGNRNVFFLTEENPAFKKHCDRYTK